MPMNTSNRMQRLALALGLSVLVACVAEDAPVPDSGVDGAVNSPSLPTMANGQESVCVDGSCDAESEQHGDVQEGCIPGPGRDCNGEPALGARRPASRLPVRPRPAPVPAGPRCTMAELEQAQAESAAARDELAQVQTTCARVDRHMQVARRRSQRQSRAVKQANIRNAEMAETLHMFLGRNIELVHENEQLRDALDSARQENERLLLRLYRIRSGELQ